MAGIVHLPSWLDHIPYAVFAILLRLAVAEVFWSSAVTKLPNWKTTIALFRDEYQVPLLPPEIAAYLATGIELSTSVMLVLGLGVRPAAAVLLGMTLKSSFIPSPGRPTCNGRPCFLSCWRGAGARCRSIGSSGAGSSVIARTDHDFAM